MQRTERRSNWNKESVITYQWGSSYTTQNPNLKLLAFGRTPSSLLFFLPSLHILLWKTSEKAPFYSHTLWILCEGPEPCQHQHLSTKSQVEDSTLHATPWPVISFEPYFKPHFHSKLPTVCFENIWQSWISHLITPLWLISTHTQGSQSIQESWGRARIKWETVSCPHLSLQPSNNFLPSLHDCFQLARDHDGKALVLCQRQLQVSSCLLHDVKADLGLLPFSKLIHVLVFPLLQRHMEHLLSHRHKKEHSKLSVCFCLTAPLSLMAIQDINGKLTSQVCAAHQPAVPREVQEHFSSQSAPH